jgi:hypothetical protein
VDEGGGRFESCLLLHHLLSHSIVAGFWESKGTRRAGSISSKSLDPFFLLLSTSLLFSTRFPSFPFPYLPVGLFLLPPHLEALPHRRKVSLPLQLFVPIVVQPTTLLISFPFLPTLKLCLPNSLALSAPIIQPCSLPLRCLSFTSTGTRDKKDRRRRRGEGCRVGKGSGRGGRRD